MKIEQALRESEERYRTIVETANDLVWTLDVNGLFTFINKHSEKLTGHKIENLLGTTFAPLIYPEDLPKVQNIFIQTMQGFSQRYEVRIFDSDGKIITLSVNTVAIISGGKTIGTVSFGRDITERIKMEEELKNTRDYLNNLFYYANAPVIVWDPQFRITRFNPAFELLTGRSTKEVIGKSLEILFPPELIARSMELIKKAQEGERWETVEIHILRVDGSVRIVLWNSASVLGIDGKTPIATIAQGQDITDRKRAEESLREINEYLENLFNYANAPVIVWDPQFRITQFNPAFELLTGRSAKEVIGKSLEILFPKDMIKSSMELIRKAQKGERWKTVEIKILRVDGAVRIVLWNSASVLGIDGKTSIATIAQGQDITERKQAEVSLRETSDYLNKLLGYANAPIIVWNPELNITRFNHAFERLTGYRTDEVVGRKLNILFPQKSSSQSLDQIQRTLKGEYWKSVEIPILRKDGKIRLALWNSANILDEDGSTLVATIAQGQDITDRKTAEDKIKASLKEKEALLREIHHRVKNNLQLISSLLNLQAANVKNKQVAKLFIESQNRIKSMALIHEELYKSRNIAKFDFSDYIKNLMTYLFNSFGINKEIISLKINVRNVSLSLDKAVLCGLIINELVSNSLKYAFPGSKKGSIRIVCSSEKNNTMIKVSDTGIGFPKQLDFRNTKSLGLQIVCALTDELDGSIELDKTKGANFKIKFSTSMHEQES